MSQTMPADMAREVDNKKSVSSFVIIAVTVQETQIVDTRNSSEFIVVLSLVRRAWRRHICKLLLWSWNCISGLGLVFTSQHFIH